MLTKKTRALILFLIVTVTGCDEFIRNAPLNITVPAAIQFNDDSQVNNGQETYETVTLFNQGGDDVIIREIFISSSYESGYGYYLEEIDEIDLIIYSNDTFSFDVYAEKLYEEHPESLTNDVGNQVKIGIILYDPDSPESESQLLIRVVNDLIDYKSDPFMIYQGNLDIEKLDILEIERMNPNEAYR